MKRRNRKECILWPRCTCAHSWRRWQAIFEDEEEWRPNQLQLDFAEIDIRNMLDCIRSRCPDPAFRRHACQGEPRKVSMRVAGDEEVIWIDLGGRDWSGVKVTKDGWQVVGEMDVAFVRSGTMLPLPIPRPGGDIRELGRVLNVRDEDFVLVAAWLLQVLNPVGDYP